MDVEDCWAVLGLSGTADLQAVKRAYAAKLKVTRPDDDAEAFTRLREAYERALQLVGPRRAASRSATDAAAAAVREAPASGRRYRLSVSALDRLVDSASHDVTAWRAALAEAAADTEFGRDAGQHVFAKIVARRQTLSRDVLLALADAFGWRHDELRLAQTYGVVADDLLEAIREATADPLYPEHRMFRRPHLRRLVEEVRAFAAEDDVERALAAATPELDGVWDLVRESPRDFLEIFSGLMLSVLQMYVHDQRLDELVEVSDALATYVVDELDPADLPELAAAELVYAMTLRAQVLLACDAPGDANAAADAAIQLVRASGVGAIMDRTDVPELLLIRANAHLSLDELAQAHATATEALALLRSAEGPSDRDDPEAYAQTLAAAWAWFVEWHDGRNEHEATIVCAREALAVADGRGPAHVRAIVDAQVAMVRALWCTNQADEARRAIGVIEALAEGDAEILRQVYYLRLVFDADTAPALLALADAAAAVRAADDDSRLEDCARGIAKVMNGEFAAGLALLERVVGSSDEEPLSWAAVVDEAAYIWMARALVALSRPAQAQTYVRAALTEFEVDARAGVDVPWRELRALNETVAALSSVAEASELVARAAAVASMASKR